MPETMDTALFAIVFARVLHKIKDAADNGTEVTLSTEEAAVVIYSMRLLRGGTSKEDRPRQSRRSDTRPTHV